MYKHQPQEFWAHKAHALLLPTPLAAPGAEPFGTEDPDEASRAQQIRQLLAQNGLAVASWTEDLRALHRSAGRDAYQAHVEAAPASDTARGLVHPLSGAPLLPASSKTARADAWSWLYKHLERALNGCKDKPEECYRALWLGLMRLKDDPFSLAQLPGHPIFNDHSILAHRSAAAALVGARLGGDTATLLHFHVGPVQGFIANARRTHDLSLGSYIIAYLSFHAIESIASTLGPDAIVYPDLAALAVYTGEGTLKSLRASLPNRFMAIVPRQKAEQVASRAASAVAQTWKDIAKGVADRLTQASPAFASDVDQARFNAQIEHHLEMDATLRAWGSTDSYEPLFKGVRNDLTAQRRVLSDLPRAGNYGDKCTQCGAHEQLGKSRRFWPKLRTQLDAYFKQTNSAQASTDGGETIDLRDGEALCAICLTKRFANRWYFGKNKENGGSRLNLDWETRNPDRLLLRFPSVASVAVSPFRHALGKHHTNTQGWWHALTQCHRALGFTPPGNLLPGLGGPTISNNHLDVDGTWCYETSYQLETALRDHDSVEDTIDAVQLKSVLTDAHGELRKLLKLLAHPDDHSIHVTPYYAVITLDVDCMGKWLDGTHTQSLQRKHFLPSINDPDTSRKITPALHREISRRQSHLASDPIYTIVERDNLGRVIYSGGDDVLAFVPLATLWRFLMALRGRFRATRDGLGEHVTLSAGVAISHWRAPLGLALQRSREAEAQAKDNGRDQIVVCLARRSGATTRVRAPWSLPKWLTDLSVLAELTSDPKPDGDTPSPRIRLQTLPRLEDELRILQNFEDRHATAAMSARTAIHLTGRRSCEIEKHSSPLLAYLLKLATPSTAGDLVSLLHLLRFLVREHEPVIAGALPEPTEEVSP